jgi:hypothetical protein
MSDKECVRCLDHFGTEEGWELFWAPRWVFICRECWREARDILGEESRPKCSEHD